MAAPAHLVKSLSFSTHIKAGVDEVYRWHIRPQAFRRLVPPWTPFKLISHDGVAPGSRAVFRIKAGPFSFKWTAEHADIVENAQFRDVQLRGPFRHWSHLHRFSVDGADCRLVDDIEYELPFSFLGKMIAGRFARDEIVRAMRYRQATAKNDIELHRRYAPREPMRVAVSGSSGLIGRNLIAFLEAGGHTVYRLVRRPPLEPAREIYWNHREDIVEMHRLENLDAVVHLAGEAVLAPRWSAQKKMEIFGSRVRGTEHLTRALGKLNRPPRVFVSASAVGYYGDRGDELLDENAPPGDDGFLSALCQEWEAAAELATEAGIRTVRLRIGIVLSPDGGVLRALLVPFRLGLGGRYGGDQQYLSWVDLDDAIGAIYHAICREDSRGAYNLSSPSPITMAVFGGTLGSILSRPTYLHVPPALVRLLLGEVADDAALMSVRARPSRLLREGYSFLYPRLEHALRHSLGRAAEPAPR